MFLQLCYAFPHYLSLGLPFRSSLSPPFSTFLFGLLSPLIDDHFTDVKPTLEIDKEEKKRHNLHIEYNNMNENQEIIGQKVSFPNISLC